MINLKWCKNLLILLALVLMVVPALAQNRADGGEGNGGGQNGNGGGGVKRDGRYMTFYSAGLFVESGEISTDDLPALKTLADFFMADPYLNSTISTRYAQAVSPSDARHYYRVQNDKFSPEIRARLIAEYGRITNVDATTLALFAVTDTQTATTYLLPEFYQLNQIEQMTILFHEAYWILNPKATYSSVVAVEVAFQKYLENQQSPEAMIAWLSKIAGANELIAAAKVSDSKTGALNSISKNQRLPVRTLLGEAALGCYLNSEGGATFPITRWDWKMNCQNLTFKNFYVLAHNNPQSMLLKSLVYLINSKMSLTVSTQASGECYNDTDLSLANFIKIDDKKSFIQLDSLESGLSFQVTQIGHTNRGCFGTNFFQGRVNTIVLSGATQ